MSVKFIVLNLAAFILSACATTTVHLNTRYLTAQQENDLVLLLLDNDFNVNTVDYAFPLNIEQSAIVYSPLLNNPQALATLEKILPPAGYPLAHRNALVEGKHWFTKNNIGVYPIPDDTDFHSVTLPANLSHKYKVKTVNQK